MRISLSGDVRATVNGTAVELGGAKSRILFAALALSAGSPVPVARLIELVWGQRPPRTAGKTLQSYVARLRSSCGAEWFDRVGDGYRLLTEPDNVDLVRFERLLERGEISAALDLWRGVPFGGLRSDGLDPIVARLTERFMTATEDDLEVRVGGGEGAALVGRLTELTSEHPSRERLWGLLMLALYQAGRQGDALRAFATARRHLVDELGVDPGPALADLEQRILAHDSDLATTESTRPVAASPSGTVTFLFTDVEDSTRLWQRSPEAMMMALERHDAILRSAIEQHAGHVFTTAGDSFAAAFTRAADAVAAAIDAQQSFGSEQWPEETDVRVRMGISTGEAQERNGDYFGLAVNRAARVMSIGNGGQILLASVTASLVDGVDLVDLGEHRLKDIPGTERLFGVVAEGLVVEFAPLRPPTNTPNNLPSEVDAFIGRATDVARVLAAVESSRLVTLTGTGGSGKTRLAVRASTELLSQFSDGVWSIELAPVSEGSAVPFVAGSAVGAVQQPGKSMLESLVDSLAARKVLLILDNCEHLLDETVELVGAIQARCPTVRMLATSREALGVQGEQLISVKSLPTDEGAELFATRAQAAGTEVSQTDPAVRRIVDQLDGLPLAIELAAARTRGLSVADLEARLVDRFRLLRGNSRGRVERHQTLWNTVTWSHQLLDPVERSVFDRLSVFAGGFTLEAAAAVCATDGIHELDIEDAILSLVERSMVIAEPGPDGTRYRLLETLRQFGENQILATAQLEDLRRVHSRWYADFADRAAAGAKGPNGVVWTWRLRAELDNYRAVVYGPDVRAARRILVSLEDRPLAWEMYEPIDWAMALSKPAAPGDADWIGMVLWAAFTAEFVARTDESAAMVTDVDPDAIPSGKLTYRWLIHQILRAVAAGDAAAQLLSEAYAVAAELDDDWDRLYSVGYIGYLAVTAGQLELAAEIWDQLTADPIRDTLPTAEASLKAWHAFYLIAVGEGAAYDELERGRRLCRDCGNTTLQRAAEAYQIPFLIERGDLQRAKTQIAEVVSHYVRAGSHLLLWLALHNLTRLLADTSHDDAREIWAELANRGDYAGPALRADLEDRLGPPGEPRLTDDELMTRSLELVRQLS